ncbi:MAG TPA: hypothetical protein VK137_14970, partial [Planctomycetaceae bacterium]|nr:hypothetical protein [Planctomycetaceae bacterium]
MNLDGPALTRATRLNKAAPVTGSRPIGRVERPRLPSEAPAPKTVSPRKDLLPAVESANELPVLEAEESAASHALPTLEEELVVDRLPPFPVPWRHPLQCLAWMMRTLFGLASLVLLLAVSAAVPLVNFWVLGYFLDVMGRIGRTGKLRAAFPLL